MPTLLTAPVARLDDLPGLRNLPRTEVSCDLEIEVRGAYRNPPFFVDKVQQKGVCTCCNHGGKVPKTKRPFTKGEMRPTQTSEMAPIHKVVGLILKKGRSIYLTGKLRLSCRMPTLVKLR